ncbi:MAG: bifunctional riboflavin kinase/FAD synthetase, partial [Alphaproteobacteria bacterium]
MKIFRHTDDLPADTKGAVVAWGNFDGFHRGHQAVFDQTARIAAKEGAPLAALTTEPHPREYFAPDAPNFRLMSLRNKAHTLEAYGVDAMFVLAFDDALANMAAEAFVQDLLVGKLGVKHVVTGYDQRYGKGRTGDTDLLIRMGKELGFDVTVVQPVQHDDVAYSSTQIRALLRGGKPVDAARLMGHWWRVEGRVEMGDQRGRTIGFPTANVAWDGYLEPKLGVYAVRAYVEEGPHQGTYDGVANLGIRPTFDKTTLTFEVHIFDFDGDLYGLHLGVDLVSFIRPEQKFNGLEALKAQ